MSGRFRNPALWLALSALAFIPQSIDAFELPHQWVLSAGALMLAPWRASHARAVVVGVAALVVLGVVTTIFSQAPWHSFSALISLWAVLAFAVSGAAGDVRPLLLAIWPMAAWAVLQATGNDFVAWQGAATWCGGVRPFSTLGHPTQLGIWAALITVLALDRARSWFGWATAAVAAAVCLLTLSRAGWLALAVGTLSWVWLKSQVKLLPWLLAAAALAVGGTVSLIGVAPLMERAANFFTAPTRFALWGTAWNGFREHPVLGWGLDTFAWVDQQYRHPDVWRFEWGGTAAHAHSFIPQILATQGVVGLAVVGGIAVWIIRRWVQIPSARRDSGAMAVVLGLAAAEMVAFAGVPLSALGLLMLMSSLDTATLPKVGIRFLKGAVAPAALLTAGMLAASIVAYAGLSREGDVAAASKGLQWAQRLEPWSALWPTRRGALWESQADQAQAAREAFESGAALAPGLAVYEANVGRVAAVQGDAAASRSWFDRARRHAPLDARIARDAAEASLRVGDFNLADHALVSSLAVYPTYGPAWVTLAALRLHQNRPVEARAAFEASLDSDWRDWPDGQSLARAALIEMLNAGGDPQRALRLANTAATAAWSAPSDICGAPAFLAR